jgi:predicted nucleic acid-binding protein
MSFLLDTDTCSAFIRGEPLVQSRFLQHGGRLLISIITEAELRQWLLRRRTPQRYQTEANVLFAGVTVLNLTPAIIQEFAKLGAMLLDQGTPMALPDQMIAATALVQSLTLVTHNTQDSLNVPGLTLLDWLTP